MAGKVDKKNIGTKRSKSRKPATRVVRLKPYDGQFHKLMSKTVDGTLFEQGRWYEVPMSLAKRLEKMTARKDLPYSPLCFDVMTSAQAKKTATSELESRTRIQLDFQPIVHPSLAPVER